MDIVPEAEPVYLKAYDPVRGRFPLSSGSGILSPSEQGPTRASAAGPGARPTRGLPHKGTAHTWLANLEPHA